MQMQWISSARAAKFDLSDRDFLPGVDESLARYFRHEGKFPFSSYVHQVVANGCLQTIDVCRISLGRRICTRNTARKAHLASRSDWNTENKCPSS
jgi:hypothetical protein